MVFNVGKCTVKIEFSFLLIIAFSLLLKTDNLLYLLLFSALHEAGHIVTLLLFGKAPDSITFSFYGIGMKHKAELPRNKELIFLLSGVFVNLVFALFNIFRNLNSALFIINILPVYPLDGGRALSLFIGDKAINIVSLITVFILITFSVLTLNISLIIICVYLLFFIIKEALYD